MSLKAEPRGRPPGLALLAGPFLWAGQFMLIYALQAIGCAARFPLLDMMLHLVSLLALVVVAWAGIVSWRYVRTFDAVQHTISSGGQLGGCMALSGVLVSAIFGLLIILGDVPVFALKTCG